ncbi:gliding motility-associated C-terminal domain-containing protein [Flavobacterium sp. 123]|uniref:gliding motility-associated C-terminal domain-containing protein n=1 Tax=Flavobacterium sp. 123 TaxID=2135627 RepID=UPI000EACE25F|nr:gliding motility-associated C-terminal domain-containing protein [Flavobacterium sp. 123]RKS99645.1 gliding motility-associated-like protein [Flavobacterium sp. 123]
MRKITLTFFLFLFEIGFSQSAPITFESGEPGSTWTFTTFENGGGLGYEKVANPDASGINTSATVAKFTALTTAAGAAPWAGCETKHGSDIGTFTLSTSNSTIKIMVWKSVISDVGIKFAIANGGAQPEIKVANTKINQWEELTFDFSGKIGLFETINIDQIIFFPDFQARTTENVCYFDNVTFSAKTGTSGGTTTSTSPTLPMDFESSTIAYSFVDFDGGLATKIANPHNTGINTSATVAQMVKGAGQPWAGSKIVLASPVDFTTNKLFKIKVWSPVAGKKLLLKFEGAGAAFEKESTGVTAANAWEELSFDFTGVAGVNNLNDNMVFIFDLGTVGDGSSNSTYLFDDVSQTTVSGGTGSTLTQMSLPTTFDDATVDYGLIGFGGAEASTVVVDPTLSTNKVVKVIKSATAELWAGTTVSAAAGLGFSSAIPFSATATKMNVRVWSPTAGIPVRLKVEDHNDNTHTVETEATVTTASGWQTLEFNFANQAAGTAALNLAFVYDKASIFFNFGTTGAVAGEKTYYFDDVAFGAAAPTTSTSPTLPMDFESSTIAYSFVDFDGGLATKIVNPHNTGINTSATAAQMVKGAGQPWAGSKIVLASPVDFTTNKLFKIKVWSPVAGKKLLLKFEGAGAAFEKESTGVTAANAWEELSFDFTGVAGVNNLNDNMVFIFDLGTVGDGSSNSTYLFDDVSQTTVSGGTGSTLTQMSLPTTFDDATVDYGLIGFGGAEASTVVVDPTLSTNKVVKVIKSAAAELWAGTTVSAAAGLGFSSAIPFSATATKMNVRVWSPTAGIPVRLKVEDHNDNTHTVETEATVTTASGWQTLEFNFANQAAGTAALNLAFVYDKASIFFNFGTTGAVAGEKTYYFDDVAFGATTPVVTAPITAAPTPPARNVADVKSVFSGAYADIAGTSWNENWGQSTVSEEVSIVGDATKKLSNLNYQGVVPTTGIDATGMTQLHLDIWTPDCTAFDVYLINPGPVEQKVTLTPTLSGWNSFDINLSDYTTIALNNVFQFKFVSPNENSTVYLDNMYFYKAATTPVVTAPITAAPTPPARNVADVKSVFSGAYADIAGTSWNENWGQSTVSEEVSIVGDATKKLSNLNYQGVVPTTGIDATGMTQLHLDIWTPDCTAFDVYLINPGPVEQKVTLTPTLSGWNSFDINLSDYTTIALNNVFQFKFVSPNENSTVYLDNMYFYKEAGVEPITGIPTNLNYGGNLRFEINKDVFSVTPTVTADPFPTFSITPELPKGMSFDTVSGSIVGKPTEENAPVSYTVTATNSVGSQQLTFTIEIFNDDHDFDGINDDIDNCSEFYNPNQEDLNNDGVGDICIEEEQVKVAQGFSPNGDGKNDVWIIKNVENHPNTQVTVFNKTGAEVFSSRDYKNLWDGSYKNTGKIVAAGSYFYQVDLGGDGSVDLQGWIYIAN